MLSGSLHNRYLMSDPSAICACAAHTANGHRIARPVSSSQTTATAPKTYTKKKEQKKKSARKQPTRARFPQHPCTRRQLTHLIDHGFEGGLVCRHGIHDALELTCVGVSRKWVRLGRVPLYVVQQRRVVKDGSVIEPCPRTKRGARGRRRGGSKRGGHVLRPLSKGQPVESSTARTAALRTTYKNW